MTCLYGWSANSSRASSSGDLVADERLVGVDDLAHPGVDALEVVVGERAAVGQLEVVVEAVLDRRADAERGAGEQVEHGLGQHVGGRVADRERPRVGVASVTMADLSPSASGLAQVALLAVDLGDDRRLGQARPDRRGEIGRGGARRQAASEPSGSVIVIWSAMGPRVPGAVGARSGTRWRGRRPQPGRRVGAERARARRRLAPRGPAAAADVWRSAGRRRRRPAPAGARRSARHRRCDRRLPAAGRASWWRSSST